MISILWIVFLGSWLWQAIYWLSILSTPSSIAKNRCVTEKNEGDQKVSVVICAHNELTNLQNFLPRILNQSHRSFEVILVDDNSDDNTFEFLQTVKNITPNFTSVKLQGDNDRPAGKKAALLAGIAAATGDIIVLTDADCYPVSDKWLSLMEKSICESRPIALGISPLDTPNSWLGALQQFETWFTYAQYSAWAAKGFPYMGVGRNLAYKAELIKSPNIFKGVDHLLSGDDDLLVNKLSQNHQASVVLAPESFTRSASPTTWRKWWKQKRRHLSVSSYYRPWQIVILGTTSLTLGLLYITGLSLAFAKFQWTIPVLFALRWMYMAFILKKWTITTTEHIPIIRVPMLDLLFALYLTIMAPTLAVKPKSWN